MNSGPFRVGDLADIVSGVGAGWRVRVTSITARHNRVYYECDINLLLEANQITLVDGAPSAEMAITGMRGKCCVMTGKYRL